MGGEQIFTLRVAVLTALFLCPVLAYADDSWECKNPDVVFCVDFAEMDGVTAYDYSRYGSTGTLLGGPARVSRKPFEFSKGTTTVSNYPPHYINFTRTLGEDVEFPLDARLDFSGKAFMTAITFNVDNGAAAGADRVIWSYANLENATQGWHYRITGQATLIYGHVAVADFQFFSAIIDFKPHSYCSWYDGSGVVAIFVDGRFDRLYTAVGSVVGGTNRMTVARRLTAGQTEFGGGVSYMRLRKNVTSFNAASRLANAYYNMVNGRNNQ